MHFGLIGSDFCSSHLERACSRAGKITAAYMTEVLAQRMEGVQDFGKLVFLGKDSERAQEYPINKNLVVLGR